MDQLDGIFSRSKLIVIQPYYIIKNKDDSISFAIAQHRFPEYKQILKPGVSTSFNWPKKSLDEFLMIAQVESASGSLESKWSNKFSIDQTGQFVLKVANGNSYSYVRVNIIREPDTPFYIILTSETRENLPLEIINKTQYEIRCYQKLQIKKKDNSVKTIDVKFYSHSLN